MAFLNGKPIFFSPHVHIEEPDIAVKSWDNVQRIVREGKAKEAFSIGDQLQCGYGDYGILTWDIIGIDHDTPSDPNFTHSLTLQLHDGLFPPLMVYSNNYDTWKDSFVRYWLNASVDEYVRPTIGSTSSKPIYYNPFLYHLDNAFLEVVGKVEKKTRSRDGATLDVTSDKFFLLSCEEAYGTSNGIYASGEGAPYQYYLNRTQHSAPSRSPDTGRIKYAGERFGNQIIKPTIVHGGILRSPANSTADFAVFRDGFITAFDALDRYEAYVVPACCIY